VATNCPQLHFSSSLFSALFPAVNDRIKGKLRQLEVEFSAERYQLIPSALKKPSEKTCRVSVCTLHIWGIILNLTAFRTAARGINWYFLYCLPAETAWLPWKRPHRISHLRGILLCCGIFQVCL